MKFLVVFIFISCILSGCINDEVPRTSSENIRIRCIDGVQYIIFSEWSGYKGYGYMSVKFKSDGKVATCNSNR